MNFYRFLFGKRMAVAEDAMVMRRHPDGSPCYAKKEEDCPILRKEKKSEEADSLKKSEIGRHLSELYNDTVGQIRKHMPQGEQVDYSELEEAYVDLREDYDRLMDGSYTVLPDSRNKRDAIFAQHKDAMYESFDLETGESVQDSQNKWGVTFHTTSAESGMSDSEYDSNCGKWAKLLDAKPQVGVYEGSCEISYCCPSLKRAAAAMVMCEQKAIFGYRKSNAATRDDEFGVDIVNFTFDKNINNLEHPARG